MKDVKEDPRQKEKSELEDEVKEKGWELWWEPKNKLHDNKIPKVVHFD